MNDWSDDENDDPLYADERNYYKVEKWTKDDQHIEACCAPREVFVCEERGTE